MAEAKNTIELSIVAPVFQGAHTIEAFYQRASKVAKTITEHYEIILIDDGSTDASLLALIAIHKRDERVIVIEHSRNFGQHKAIWTGLNHARGQKVFVLDSDLEEEPEWLPKYLEKMKTTGADVVFATQQKRKGSLFERLSGEGFYFFLKHALGMKCITNIITARLMTKQYAQALANTKEQGFELTVIAYAIGFKHAILPVTKHATSKSSYSLMGKIQFFERYVIAASTAPLRWIIVSGLACMAYAILSYVASIITPTTGETDTNGLWFLAGAILTSLGIVGLYVANIAEHVRHRPITIIRNIWRQ